MYKASVINEIQTNVCVLNVMVSSSTYTAASLDFVNAEAERLAARRSESSIPKPRKGQRSGESETPKRNLARTSSAPGRSLFLSGHSANGPRASTKRSIVPPERRLETERASAWPLLDLRVRAAHLLARPRTSSVVVEATAPRWTSTAASRILSKRRRRALLGLGPAPPRCDSCFYNKRLAARN
jgi:hypothetical protein